jgi:hypothetical protein
MSIYYLPASNDRDDRDGHPARISAFGPDLGQILKVNEAVGCITGMRRPD